MSSIINDGYEALLSCTPDSSDLGKLYMGVFKSISAVWAGIYQWQEGQVNKRFTTWKIVRDFKDSELI